MTRSGPRRIATASTRAAAEAFLSGQVTAGKAAAKLDLETAVNAAGTPEAKTKALEDMLAAAELAAKTTSDEREASRVDAELVSIKIAMEANYTVIAAQQKLANATTGREKLEVEIADAEKLIASVTGGRDLQLVVGERNTARDNKAWAYEQLATKDGSPAAPAPGLDGAKQAELDAKQKQQDAETLALSAGTKAADVQTAANGAMDTATSASGKVDEITKRAGELDKLVARHKELSTIIAAAQERLVDAPPGLTDDVEQELASAKEADRRTRKAIRRRA